MTLNDVPGSAGVSRYRQDGLTAGMKQIVEAQALASNGVSDLELARRYDKSVATIRRWLSAHACICGRPIVSRYSTNCTRCRKTDRLPCGDYAKQEIAAGIVQWVAEVGKPPARSDWRPRGHPHWTLDRFPPAARVYPRPFKTGKEALAYVDPDYCREKPRAWTDDELLDQIRDFYHRHGIAPTTTTWDSTPSVMTIEYRFDGWANAIHQAGIPPVRVQRQWDLLTDEEVCALYREWGEELGNTPSQADRTGPLGRYPSPPYMARRFRTHNRALIKCGLPVQKHATYTGDEIVPALIAYFDENGTWPTVTIWRQRRLRPSFSASHRKVGFTKAITEAQRVVGARPPTQTAASRRVETTSRWRGGSL